MALQHLLGPGLFVNSVFILYTDGRTPWTSDKPIARPLPTHRTTQTQNKRIHRHPYLEWDSNSRSQRLSKRRALDRAATVICSINPVTNSSPFYSHAYTLQYYRRFRLYRLWRTTALWLSIKFDLSFMKSGEYRARLLLPCGLKLNLPTSFSANLLY
jgi:hypothetical protein